MSVERSHHPLLRPGSNCWRVERANRASLLADGAAYFHAMYAAMKNARRSILLLGWDFDPRAPFEPAPGQAEPSERFCDLMERLIAREPHLQVHILVWDMPVMYTVQRRTGPQEAEQWLPKERVHYRLDSNHPAGAAHHQKILVIDDGVAFCGGSDFSRNRWDTPEHLPGDRRRRTRDNRIYGPRHDVVLAVDGPAAASLADLVRERWRRATGQSLRASAAARDPWPRHLVPDMTSVQVGVTRTEPAWAGLPAVGEIEALYLDAIAAARRWIYLENQYFTSAKIGDALARRLAEPDGPEIVVTCAARSGGLFDRLVMDHARNHLVHRLQLADSHGHFRAFVALAAGDVPIIVHSKVMIVDDRLLRVGSANLNNRSLGLDTECDLAIEVQFDDERGREGVRWLLDRLVTEHLARRRGEVKAALERTGSLLASVDALNSSAGRRLAPLFIDQLGLTDRLMGEVHLFDPAGAADNWRPWKRNSQLSRGQGP